jgi:hypothetical protein
MLGQIDSDPTISSIDERGQLSYDTCAEQLNEILRGGSKSFERRGMYGYPIWIRGLMSPL